MGGVYFGLKRPVSIFVYPIAMFFMKTNLLTQLFWRYSSKENEQVSLRKSTDRKLDRTY